MSESVRRLAAKNREHSQRMRKLQAEQRDKVANKINPDNGLVLIFTGNGKGKSTAAFGVLARALGWGHQVGVVQFVKGSWKTGESQFFSRFPDQIEWRISGQGFTWDTQDRDADIATAQSGLNIAREMLTGGHLEVVVLDEINLVLNFEYLQPSAVQQCLEDRSPRTHVILTGRDAPSQLIDYADLVSDVSEVKHPFHSGIKAQRGIDV